MFEVFVSMRASAYLFKNYAVYNKKKSRSHDFAAISTYEGIVAGLLLSDRARGTITRDIFIDPRGYVQ